MSTNSLPSNRTGGTMEVHRRLLNADTVFAGRGTAPSPLVSPRVPSNASIEALSRSADKLDIFVTDQNGVIYTAAWEPSFPDWWHGWWAIGE